MIRESCMIFYWIFEFDEGLVYGCEIEYFDVFVGFKCLFNLFKNVRLK